MQPCCTWQLKLLKLAPFYSDPFFTFLLILLFLLLCLFGLLLCPIPLLLRISCVADHNRFNMAIGKGFPVFSRFCRHSPFCFQKSGDTILIGNGIVSPDLRIVTALSAAIAIPVPFATITSAVINASSKTVIILINDYLLVSAGMKARIKVTSHENIKVRSSMSGTLFPFFLARE